MASNISSTSSASYSYLQGAGGRYSGLASGIDTESIMEKIMQAKSVQKEKLQQKYQKYEWKRDAYRDFHTKLSSLRDELYDNFQLTSKWNVKNATGSNSAVSVKASSTANGTLSISEVKLATAGRTITTDKNSKIDNGGKATTTTKLSDINEFSSLFTSSDTATIKLKDASNNEFEFQVNKTDTVSSLISRINSTKAGNNENILLSASLVDGKLSIKSFGTTNVGISSTANDATTAFNSLIGSNANAYSSNTKLSDVTELSGKFVDGKATLQFANGEEVEVTETDTLSEVADKILTKTGGALGATYSESTGFSIFEDAGTISGIATEDNAFLSSLSNLTTSPSASTTITSNDKLADLGLSDGEFTLNVLQNDGSMKATTIKYSATDTVSSFVSKINSSGAGVTALFSNGQFSLAVNATGENPDKSNNYAVELTGGTNIFNKFGVSSAPLNLDSVSYPIGLIENGSDASYTINGVEMTSSTNTVSLNGYTITFNNDHPTTSAPITVTASTDTDAMVDKIKSFVTKYNELISSISTKTSEKVNYDYEPLTDAQKSEMTDDEIKKWEEKSKSGLLRNDNSLKKVVSDLRNTMYSQVGNDSTYKYLFDIGITTSSTYTDGGKLEIDENKLKEAIEVNADAVMKMFTDIDTGIISKTRKILKTGADSIKEVAGTKTSVESSYSLGKQMSSLKTKIDDWTERLKDIEERYWAQFTAMETAISKANSTTSMFA